MANKVTYNDANYDILNAITLADRNYIILMDSNDIGNLTFLESSIVNGERKFTLPPKSYDVNEHKNSNLKRLQLNFLVHLIINIIKEEYSHANIRTKTDINSKFNEIKNFIHTDLDTKYIIDDEKNLNIDTFSKIAKFLESHLKDQFITSVKKDEVKQYSYLERPIVTVEGLDTEWLYELSSNELEELVKSGKTSTELIYISDALNKAKEREQSIKNYEARGHVKTLKMQDRNAAFIDTFLLSAITASFYLLLLLSIF